MTPLGLSPEPSWTTVLFPADPQLDTNVLIQLIRKEPEFVAYVQAEQPLGLSYNVVVAAEFLTLGKGTGVQLQLLEQQYGVKLIQDVSLQEIDTAAARLQAAFARDPLHRTLREEDARVAASAFLKQERLATGDIQLFKRAKDLGLEVDFVGTGQTAARAVAYQPRIVSIP
jgi:predicted nucleic acid-binding protein